jgi:glycosyltransferase involved in cell wall biosynthesis
MMKNLVICENFKYPLDEGGTKLTAEFIKSLNGKITIINFGGKLPIKDAIIIPISYSNMPILGFIIGRLLSLIYVIRIKPDNIYYFPLSSPGVINQVYAFILSKLTKNFEETLYQTGNIRGLSKLFSKFNINVISKTIADDLTKNGFKAKYISIFCHKDQKKYEKEKIREKYGIKKDEFVVLHIGHMERERGLRIFSHIQEMMSDTKVVLVLSSRKKAQENNLSAKIEIINRYIDDIYEVYAMSDVYLFPILSKKSAIDAPLSIIEAMEMNLPIIASDIGVIGEMLKGYPKKYLVKIEDEIKMAKEIKRILESEFLNFKK